MHDAEERQDTQVVIVGAGPTGLAAATLLGLYGIETVLLESKPDLTMHPRAVAIDDEGLRICQALGLREEIMAHVLLNLSVEYRSGKQKLAQVTPKNQPNAYPLVSTFHQPTLEKFLLDGLKRFPCVKIYFNHRLENFIQTETQIKLQVRTPSGSLLTYLCQYMLACDGGKSTIRHRLGIAMSPISPFPLPLARAAATGQRWLVVDGPETESTERKHIIFFCNPARPAVTVPTPNQTRRWEFMLFPNERAEEILKPGTLQRLIAQTNFSKHRSSASTPSQQATEPTRQAIYTFHRLLASSFSQGRIFLLGDAAHLMPPFGGQGLNSGLRDAYNLCWKLAYVLQTGRSVELLESYQRERAPHTASMIRFSALLGQAIMPTQPILASIRDSFFRGINLIPQIREILNEMKVKPGARYQETTSSLLKLKKTLIGTLLPQTHVFGPDEQTLLLDELLGQGFTLLRLSQTKNSGEIQGEIFYLDSAPFTLSQPEHRANTRFIAVDQQQQLSRITRQSHGRWLLLRPDHFILDMLPGQQTLARKANADKDCAADHILFYRYHNDLHQPQ